MSRGPGCWQRAILAALDECEIVRLAYGGMAEREHSAYSALLRAAHTLAQRGGIGLARVFEDDRQGRRNVALVAVRPDAIERLRACGVSVETGLKGTDSTHRTRRMRGSLRAIGAQTGVSKSTVQRWARLARAGDAGILQHDEGGHDGHTTF